MSEAEVGSSVVTESPVNTGNSASMVETIDMTPKTLESKIAAPAAQKEEVLKEKISPKLVKLAAREAKAAEREAEADRKLQEAEQKLTEAQQSRQLIDKIKTQPSKFFEEVGMTFNELANALLSETPGEEKKTPSELEIVKQNLAEIQNKLKAEEDAKTQAKWALQDKELDAAIDGVKTKVNEYINENPDKYDLIIATDNSDLVHETMIYAFNESLRETGAGQIMPFKEACDVVEAYLTKEQEEQEEKRKALLIKSKKLQNFNGVKTEPKVSLPKPKTSFGKTLSSKMTTQSPAVTSNQLDMSKLSHSERIKVLSKRLVFN